MYSMTIAGNSVNDVGSATTIVLPILGAQPALVGDVNERVYNGGHRRIRPVQRLRLNVVACAFSVDPTDDSGDSRTYFELMAILRSTYVWVTEFSEEVLRMSDATRGLVTLGTISLPMLVDLESLPEPSAVFDDGADELSFTLLTRDLV